jgi:hypothetical protein
MRYLLLGAASLALVACQINMGGGGAASPQAAPDPNAQAATPATPVAAATPEPAGSAKQIQRIRRPGPDAPPGTGVAPATTPTGTTPVAAPTGTTTPPPAEAPPIQGSNDFGSGSPSGGAFRGTIYFIPDSTQKVPRAPVGNAIATVYTDKFDVSPREFTRGFPGVNNRFEWFNVQYDGTFDVAKDGDYKFRLLSDDGAVFLVDGNVVVDNDGVHSPSSKEGHAVLKAGQHRLQLFYFQGPATEIALQLFVTAPQTAERIFTSKL